MFKIGNVKIDNNVCLAPMAGVCNSAFRRIVKEMGCGLIYAEMVSDKAICYDNEKTMDMLYMTEEERPIAQQIFGSDVDSFVKAAKKLEETMHPDIIDINMGCPVPKVAVRAQAGSALLKDPEKIYEIVKAVKKSVNVPVTVKIRSGWDKNSINAVEVAKTCEKAGASAIAVHPRTRSQGYSGKADWNIIKEVKQNVNIPVIGNGDIKTVDDAIKMIKETNCDAIMIGRGVLGNPYLIKQIVTYFKTGEKLSDQTPKEKMQTCLKHFNYLLEIKPEKVAVLEMRTHAAWYLKGLFNATYVKEKLYKLKTKEEFIKTINDYINTL
ncbi:MAG TPA: tRNA dihydrouridine synthase DusB [Candidatus Aphodocola excrementigallinarum]|uniref:tRNA-dihydrouridine synthase n=1 Tax=Candidatus Aphodocola excrementigallinarum TaxID=2840670 RepID=A0A9D1INL3_9FIRM|nr:tRNA dihydrouridine synthase DusB [Candidatus Aphodocola excrementigallinarum]